MNTIKFGTTIYDIKKHKCIKGGIEVEVEENELEVLRKVFERAHTARRWGFADDDCAKLLKKKLDTQLLKLTRYDYAFEMVLMNGEQAICGSSGL